MGIEKKRRSVFFGVREGRKIDVGDLEEEEEGRFKSKRDKRDRRGSEGEIGQCLGLERRARGTVYGVTGDEEWWETKWGRETVGEVRDGDRTVGGVER